MKTLRKIISARHLLFGALYSLLFLLIGCEDIVDTICTDTYVYNNKTDVVVRFEVYENKECLKTWTVESGQSLEQVYIHAGGSNKQGVIVAESEIVRVIFDDAKEVWFNKSNLSVPYNIYNPGNYQTTHVERLHTRYEFDISEAMMNAATAIKPAR